MATGEDLIASLANSLDIESSADTAETQLAQGSDLEMRSSSASKELSQLSSTSHLQKPFVPSGTPSDQQASTTPVASTLNATAVEFVPTFQAPSVPKQKGRNKRNQRQANGYQQYWATPNGNGYHHPSNHSQNMQQPQDWATWNQMQHGTQPYSPEGANGYGDALYEEGNGHALYANNEGYPYMDMNGYQAAEGKADEGYELYDGAYANGDLTHNAVYNSLFDDHVSPEGSSNSTHADQQSNGHVFGNGWDQDRAATSTSPHVSPIEAMMAVLSEQYPAYSQGSLREILDLRGGDIGGALDMLARNEANAAPDTGMHGKAAPTPAAKPPTLDEDNFPTLGGTTPKESPNKASVSTTNGFAAALQRPASSSPNDSSGHNAKSGGWQNGVPQANGVAQPAKAHANGHSAGSGNDVPWLQTGEAVAATYEQARREARDQARLRNTCFQQATQAFLAGNKALAKELGAKGRAHAEHMQAAHAAAAEAIYRQRNSHKNGGGLQLIDLHGLHAREAVEVLRREVKALRDQKQASRQPGASVRVSVIVGTGHHTKGKHTPARLPIAVQEWLQGEGISNRQPKPGMIEIVI